VSPAGGLGGGEGGGGGGAISPDSRSYRAPFGEGSPRRPDMVNAMSHGRKDATRLSCGA